MKAIEKPITTIIFINTGFKFSILIISIVFNKSFEFIYQYAGKICATFNTVSGSHSAGTKAPQRKDDPSAITFIIPLIASLLFINVLINNAIVSEQKVNINEFSIYVIPLGVNITSPTNIIPIIVKKTHTILE